MSSSVDETWPEVLRCAPEEIREDVRRVPEWIGVSTRGRFSDYASQAPMVDLPAFTGARECDRYRRAHHVGGYAMLARDRMADGQADRGPSWERTIAFLEERWIASLADACGDERLAAARVAAAMDAWHRGTSIEREILGRGGELVEYRQAVRDKTRWLAVAAATLVREARGSDAEAEFLDVFDAIMLPMQLLDDALDVEEDQRVRGRSFPDALGFGAGALFQAARLAMRDAAERAARAQLERLTAWCTERVEWMDGMSGQWGLGAHDALGAIIVVAELSRRAEACS